MNPSARMWPITSDLVLTQSGELFQAPVDPADDLLRRWSFSVPISVVAADPGAGFFALAGTSGGGEDVLRLYSSSSPWTPLETYPLPLTGSIQGLGIHPDGHSVYVVASSNGTTIVYTVER